MTDRLLSDAALAPTPRPKSGNSRRIALHKLQRTQVVKLGGEPLTIWESFERFGGYFASAGTFGLGLLDFWREPNRRLAHDRLSNTVVVRRP